jgi:hypothetical protein
MIASEAPGDHIVMMQAESDFIRLRERAPSHREDVLADAVPLFYAILAKSDFVRLRGSMPSNPPLCAAQHPNVELRAD